MALFEKRGGYFPEFLVYDGGLLDEDGKKDGVVTYTTLGGQLLVRLMESAIMYESDWGKMFPRMFQIFFIPRSVHTKGVLQYPQGHLRHLAFLS